MRKRVAFGGLALLAVLLLVPTRGRAQEKVDIKVVKYGGLGEAIQQLKGKVVVVDFWADW
jgi:thiol:disulfide interchange protein